MILNKIIFIKIYILIFSNLQIKKLKIKEDIY